LNVIGHFKGDVKRLISSPLKLIGLLTILLGLALAILTLGYLIVLGLIFIGVGLIVYFVDNLTRRLFKKKETFWTAQYVLTAAYLILAFITYMKWQEYNAIVFPKAFTGQAGIVFGIEGFPALPETKFWKKTINIPENGLIITSTKAEDIPSRVRFSFTGNSKVDYSQIDWDPNFEIDCITSDSKIKSWLFQVSDSQSFSIKSTMTDLCNQIYSNQIRSFYKSQNSVVWADDNGKYLWLQDKGLTSLPNGLDKLNIYKAILTGNNLRKIPPQIFEIASLQDLILAVNPISEFPCELQKLKRLKSVSFADTEIKEINCDLSKFDSLEHFDLARNNLTKLPEQIKNIPNLTWLSLNDNQFVDLSFIDNRFDKLETLYLYSNKVYKLSKETWYLGNLKELLIFDNKIDSIPDNISDLRNLEKLEIWNNPIKYISPNISKLTMLKALRLDDDMLSQADKDNLRKWLPSCEINYQTRKQK
jgi:hypothetical protein